MINETNNLDRTAIIDCRGPDEGLFHDAYRAFAVRARLDREHGGHANQLIWQGPVDVSRPTAHCQRKQLHRHGPLGRGDRDRPLVDVPLARKVPSDKPATSPTAATTAPAMQGLRRRSARCVVHVYGTPRTVAGDAITTDTNKCRLSRSSAATTASSSPRRNPPQLRATFPDGVCDFSKPGVGQHHDDRLADLPAAKRRRDLRRPAVGPDADRDRRRSSRSTFRRLNASGLPVRRRRSASSNPLRLLGGDPLRVGERLLLELLAPRRSSTQVVALVGGQLRSPRSRSAPSTTRSWSSPSRSESSWASSAGGPEHLGPAAPDEAEVIPEVLRALAELVQASSVGIVARLAEPLAAARVGALAGPAAGASNPSPVSGQSLDRRRRPRSISAAARSRSASSSPRPAAPQPTICARTAHQPPGGGSSAKRSASASTVSARTWASRTSESARPASRKRSFSRS